MTERTEAEHIEKLELAISQLSGTYTVVDSIQWALDKIKEPKPRKYYGSTKFVIEWLRDLQLTLGDGCDGDTADSAANLIEQLLEDAAQSEWHYIEDGLPVDDVMYDFATTFEGPCIFRNEPLSMISKYAGVYAYRTHSEDVPPPVRNK